MKPQMEYRECREEAVKRQEKCRFIGERKHKTETEKKQEKYCREEATRKEGQVRTRKDHKNKKQVQH